MWFNCACFVSFGIWCDLQWGSSRGSDRDIAATFWNSNNHHFGWRTSQWYAFHLSACVHRCMFVSEYVHWAGVYTYWFIFYLADGILEYFLDTAMKYFIVGRIDQAQFHPDYHSQRVAMYVLVKKWNSPKLKMATTRGVSSVTRSQTVRQTNALWFWIDGD